MIIRSEKANRREFQQKKKKSKETIKKGSKQRSVGEGRIRAEDTQTEERKIGNRKTQKQKSRKAQKQEKERSNESREAETGKGVKAEKKKKRSRRNTKS